MNDTGAFLRAIRGPVVLIALGTLMTLDHFTNYNIGRTWPALLVVAGVMVLLERTLGSHNVDTPHTGGLPQ